MVNCNPETVSTDYDTSDRLYFEPLTLEDVLGVIEVERPEGVIVQFGGQTPLKLAAGLAEAGVPLLGTSVDAIDLAEDRGRFGALLDRARLRGPAVRDGALRRRGARCRRAASASRCSCGPPTCSAAGRWRSSTPATASPTTCDRDVGGTAPAPRPEIFLDRFLEDAIEVDVDALCDGERRLDRRDHAARRGGRRPLRRLRLRAAAALARRRHARADPRGDARHRPRARRRRPAQRPVRRPRRARCT